MKRGKQSTPMDRAYAALGAEGLEEINKLVVKEVVRLGFGDPRILDRGGLSL
ncbi:MAG: hypothetical protein HY731_04285 [Candidatus Tectomicrobia bacterium]|nr:hypothetical protein [Candidatus Tectomicrobia bacterium]